MLASTIEESSGQSSSLSTKTKSKLNSIGTIIKYSSNIYDQRLHFPFFANSIILFKLIMKRVVTIVSLLAALTSDAQAFVPAVGNHQGSVSVLLNSSPSSMIENTLYYANVQEQSSELTQQTPEKTPPPKKGSPKHKGGILSPLVISFKVLFGEERLNKIRAKAISVHSDVIANFVDSSETTIGDVALKKLFELTDSNGDGTIDESELKKAFQALDFDWIQEKQIKGIIQRADIDENGVIDFLEWKKEVPKTLRTNLIKLAKRNGGNLGLLA